MIKSKVQFLRFFPPSTAYTRRKGLMFCFTFHVSINTGHAVYDVACLLGVVVLIVVTSPLSLPHPASSPPRPIILCSYISPASTIQQHSKYKLRMLHLSSHLGLWSDQKGNVIFRKMVDGDKL